MTLLLLFRMTAILTPTKDRLEKTIPPNDPATFEYTGTASGTISDNRLITVTSLPPENYTSTQLVPAGWELTSIVCNDTDSDVIRGLALPRNLGDQVRKGSGNER